MREKRENEIGEREKRGNERRRTEAVITVG